MATIKFIHVWMNNKYILTNTHMAKKWYNIEIFDRYGCCVCILCVLHIYIYIYAGIFVLQPESELYRIQYECITTRWTHTSPIYVFQYSAYIANYCTLVYIKFIINTKKKIIGKRGMGNYALLYTHV